MTDFFAGLRGSGIQGPDAVFDQSSIMPSGGGPHSGYQGIPDGRINATSSLLNPGQPYAYGNGARLGSDAAYIAHPHNVQKIIPQFTLPDTTEDSERAHNFMLSHPVSDGDVAWVLRYDNVNSKSSHERGQSVYKRQGLLRAVDHIVSLATVNYLLAGMQIDPQPNPSWEELKSAFGLTNYSDSEELAKMFVRDNVAPFGVVIGSDKQGGQHQNKNGPCTWPVDFVCTITVDGRNENLQNMWPCCSVSSADSLQFVLKEVDCCATGVWRFDLAAGKFSCIKTLHVGKKKKIWQLVPMTDATRQRSVVNSESHPHGKYWHFASSFKSHGLSMNEDNHLKTTRMARGFHRGALMQTFVAPMWYDEDEMDSPRTLSSLESSASNILTSRKTEFEKAPTTSSFFPKFAASQALRSPGEGGRSLASAVKDTKLVKTTAGGAFKSRAVTFNASERNIVKSTTPVCDTPKSAASISSTPGSDALESVAPENIALPSSSVHMSKSVEGLETSSSTKESQNLPLSGPKINVRVVKKRNVTRV